MTEQTLTNFGRDPVEIRAPSGKIIWRHLSGGWLMHRGDGLQLHTTGEFTESSHDYLVLSVGGFANLIEQDGNTIAFGTGISAPV